MLTGADYDAGEGWLRARNSRGDQGFVPQNYLDYPQDHQVEEVNKTIWRNPKLHIFEFSIKINYSPNKNDLVTVFFVYFRMRIRSKSHLRRRLEFPFRPWTTQSSLRKWKSSITLSSFRITRMSLRRWRHLKCLRQRNQLQHITQELIYQPRSTCKTVKYK